MSLDHLADCQRYANCKRAAGHVNIEHCFGILKARWQILTNASLRLKTERNAIQASIIIRVCTILHNLLINTWHDHLLLDDIAAANMHQYDGKAMEVFGRDIGLDMIEEQGLRRHHLVREMLAIDPDCYPSHGCSTKRKRSKERQSKGGRQSKRQRQR